MSTTTKLTTPNPKSKSLRTSVPTEVRNALNLSNNDEIKWIIKAVDNKIICEIEKVEE